MKKNRKQNTPHYVTAQVTVATEIGALQLEFTRRQVSEYFWNSIFVQKTQMSEFFIQLLTLYRL